MCVLTASMMKVAAPSLPRPCWFALLLQHSTETHLTKDHHHGEGSVKTAANVLSRRVMEFLVSTDERSWMCMQLIGVWWVN